MDKKLFLGLMATVFSLTVSAQKIGGKVRVNERGTWETGTLLSIKNGQYFVHFLSRSDSYDRMVAEKDIVFIDGDDRKPIIKRDTITIVKTVRDTLIIKIPADIPPAASWKTGDKVEVIWASEWYPATIIEIKDQKYKISYEGYSALWDEWVNADKIRKR
ncbi:MAG: hypothetical protein IPQ06_08815 [Chitinophagaceae bacterium]|nr:hypothetical protein [Chitinophagaceae bacterium]